MKNKVTPLKAPKKAEKKERGGYQFYKVEELADELRVCDMTIYRYIKSKKLKAHKIGREFRIPKAEYKKFLLQTTTS